MFSRLANLFRAPDPPLDRLRRIAAEHDGRSTETDTLQGALADAILMLRSEANRNGWQNWGENYEECVDLLIKYLCEGAEAFPPATRGEVRRKLEAIREAGQTGADYGRFAYEECDEMVEQVLAWCESRRRPIQKPPGQSFW